MTRADDVASLVETARAEGMTIRWANVNPSTLDKAQTVAVYDCEDQACGRVFLLVSQEVDARTRCCSPECSERSRRRRQVQRARLQVKAHAEAIRVAERERAALCPRPDKMGWNTEEAAWQIVRMMRRAGRPRARDLHAYLCDTGGPEGRGCGMFHVGDRTRRDGDPVTERWGSAYDDERDEADDVVGVQEAAVPSRVAAFRSVRTRRRRGYATGGA